MLGKGVLESLSLVASIRMLLGSEVSGRIIVRSGEGPIAGLRRMRSDVLVFCLIFGETNVGGGGKLL